MAKKLGSAKKLSKKTSKTTKSAKTGFGGRARAPLAALPKSTRAAAARASGQKKASATGARARRAA